ncbi:MAG: hypothetical protein ACXU8U_09580 [Asticcacaulis sp.]
MSCRFLFTFTAGALIALPTVAQTVAAPPANTAAAVENHSRPHARIHRLAVLDTDRDNKVSWTEFSARLKAAFDRLDVNHDGYLEASELPHGGKRGKGLTGGAWGKPSDNPPPFVSGPPEH